MTLRTSLRTSLLLAGVLILSACGRNMYDQAKFTVHEPNPFFADGTTNQTPPEGTVSRSWGAMPEPFVTGIDDNGLLTEIPMEVSEDLLTRGQTRYNIYCSPCHNFSGNGRGMIVQKGFVQPSSFHEERLQQVPVGYFYNAITNGFGRMYSYASRIPPEDRWAIAAYIRALQYSQNADMSTLPEADRVQFDPPQQPQQEVNR